MSAVPYSVPQGALGCDPKYYDQWLNEVRFFVSHRAEFVANPALNGKWIALRQNQIVDQDDDEFELSRRVRQQYPEEVVLISKVEPESQVKVYERPWMEIR